MPPLTRALVRAALGWLVAGFLLLLVAATAPLRDEARSWAMLAPAAVHAVVVGFVTQMIFGVALWMFPRPRASAAWHAPLGWTMLACLNAGLVLRLLAEPLVALLGTSAWGHALAAGALLQWLAAAAFAVLAWPRVRAR